MGYRRQQVFPRLLMWFAVWLSLASAAHGDGSGDFEITHATSELVEGVYHLDVNVHYDFSDAVIEALESGVPIIIELEIDVVRPRRWIWDVTEASLSQRYRVEFHALSGQYVVTNLNSGAQASYPSRRLALNAMGTVHDLPVLDRRLLDSDDDYEFQVRAQLVLSELPSPLRLWAYLSSDWRLKSDWYTWAVE